MIIWSKQNEQSIERLRAIIYALDDDLEPRAKVDLLNEFSALCNSEGLDLNGQLTLNDLPLVCEVIIWNRYDLLEILLKAGASPAVTFDPALVWDDGAHVHHSRQISCLELVREDVPEGEWGRYVELLQRYEGNKRPKGLDEVLKLEMMD